MSLVSAVELSRILNSDHPPVLLDVRWSLAGGADAEGYHAGHLPGAVFVDLDRQLCGPPGPEGRHPLPDPEALQAVLRQAGVTAGGMVVVYDGGDMLAASRAWWTLRWAGVARPAPVVALNGGIAAWKAIDGPLSTETPAVTPSDFVVSPGGLPVLDAEAAAELARTGTLLDVRSPERYRGESEPIDPVAGHIPGAVNAPADQTMADDHGFVDSRTIRERYWDHRAAESLGVYCGSGVTAARTALALTTAGLGTPAVYIGSWSSWVADKSRPVALGDE